PPISVDRLRELQTFMESYTEVREGGHEMVTEPMTAFDPNTLELQGRKKLGVPERQAHAALRYKAKRGGVHRKEDRQKMYAMPEAVYQRIEPYLLFPQTSKKSYPDKSDVDDKAAWATILPPASVNEKRRVTPPKKVWVEINTADSLELLTLTGIGPSYASR